MNTMRYLSMVACLGLACCTNFEYSPNQAFDGQTPRNLNAANIQKIQADSGDDTVRFALTGDTQRSYTNASDFVALANKVQGLDFVLLDGDISDFGLLAEMKEVHGIYSRLKVPYVAVIGNHDLAGNGENAYRSMYGNLDFSFVYRDIRFICQNTNSREFKFRGTVPDLDWLKNELSLVNANRTFISIGHVPPTSQDFDQALRTEYLGIVQEDSRAIACLYAHTGKTELINANGAVGAPIFITGGIDNRKYSIVTIVHGKASVQNFDY